MLKQKELVPRILQVLGHLASHDAEADETDVCHLMLPFRVRTIDTRKKL